MGDDDFFVSEANAQAHEMVTGQTAWPERKLALIGPPGSGKTHLARIWADRTGARIVAARDLPERIDLPSPASSLCVEDVDTLPAAGEEALFHLHNNILAAGGRLLLTARRAPARWSIALPDLASRMSATSVARIADPDDDLLRAVLTKLFDDRQLRPDPKLLAWLLPRMERSFEAAGRIVADCDRRALSETRVINISLAREILGPTPSRVGQS